MRSGWLDLDTPAQDADTAPDAIDAAIRWSRRLVVVLLYAVSPLALMLFGWNYYDTGGSPLTRERCRGCTGRRSCATCSESRRYSYPVP